METMEEDIKPLISKGKPKGGLRTLPFILGSQGFEKMASFGLMPNMVLYLTRVFRMDVAAATNVIMLWSAATYLMPIIGAFLADSFVGRYPTIAFGTVVNVLGTLLFWLTTMIPQLSPSCDQITKSCSSATAAQLAFLYVSFGLMAIGAGGVRASSLAFGMDQLKNNNAGIRENYFNWTYAITTMAILVGMTVLVYLQENLGWKVGFGVPVVLMLISMVSFLLGSSFYVKLEVKGNVMSNCAQVVVASCKNRHLNLPPYFSDGMYYSENDSAMFMPSDKLRFLNKACLIKNPQEDLTQDGRAKNPWSLCTVQQVEALKSLIKIIPIWISGMIMSVNMSQGSLFILQAYSMDRHITPDFQIPAGSIGTFLIFSAIFWIFFYDRIIIPLASKVRGQPTRLRVKQKMGIGLFAVCLSIASLAIVEGVRRQLAIEEGFQDHPEGVVSMSVLWLLPRQFLDGFAEVFFGVGQNEFYITELPQSMSSIASCLPGLGNSGSHLISSIILSIIDKVTKAGGGVSWVSSNINQGHLDYYCWVIFGIMVLNVLYFLYCSKAYGPCKGEKNEGQDEGHC
ncbi:hypothetical protein VNO78_30689 [Psophocarpus tetragonolobus]|uniref:Protein NRT1/ PTR FAMILY 1.2-like n=1 Tax=Psophocarpus tetragonolobus TaxID=3891 RepID=A0AAN9RYE3_PSOTE